MTCESGDDAGRVALTFEGRTAGRLLIGFILVSRRGDTVLRSGVDYTSYAT